MAHRTRSISPTGGHWPDRRKSLYSFYAAETRHIGYEVGRKSAGSRKSTDHLRLAFFDQSRRDCARRVGCSGRTGKSLSANRLGASFPKKRSPDPKLSKCIPPGVPLPASRRTKVESSRKDIKQISSSWIRILIERRLKFY